MFLGEVLAIIQLLSDEAKLATLSPSVIQEHVVKGAFHLITVLYPIAFLPFCYAVFVNVYTNFYAAFLTFEV